MEVHDVTCDPPAAGGSTYNTGSHVVIYLTSKTHGTVAHECLHAANYISQNIGHKADEDNDEVIAYILGYLVEVIHRELKIKCRKEYEWDKVKTYKVKGDKNAC